MNPKINPTSPEGIARFLEQAAEFAERGPFLRWFARDAKRIVRALQGELEEMRGDVADLRKERDHARAMVPRLIAERDEALNRLKLLAAAYARDER